MGEPAMTVLVEAEPTDRGLVALRDGRSIAWTAWGPRDGATVVNQPCIGVSGQGLALAVDVAPLIEAGLRVVVVCRAGLGTSTRRPGRNEQTDAEDMLQVIDALHLDRANLLGECGGTGAVLALAAGWPDRVRAIGLVSAMAPLAGPDADGYVSRRLRSVRRSLRFGPIARWSTRSMASGFRRNPTAYLERAWRTLPTVDRVFAADPARWMQSLATAPDYLDRPDRILDEWRSVTGPWTFDLSAVRSPVLIDHGARDRLTPVAMATWLSERLPRAELRIDPDRGHYLEPDRWPGIFRRLVALG
jgi:pimeloyl-ACP methyl ester carboxylesterase